MSQMSVLPLVSGYFIFNQKIVDAEFLNTQ